MAMDPMQFARPQRPAYTDDIRPVRSSEQIINGRSVDDLATNPASKAYRSKIPPPPCVQCGEDHTPGRAYDHDYVLEAPQRDYVHSIEPPVLAPPSSPQQGEAKRVAVYIGRNDTFVVAVEEGPEWDAVETFKVIEDQLLAMVQMARALGIKVQDKTGGDLAALEQA